MTYNGDILDNDELTNHSVDYSFSHGANFGAPARIASGIFGMFVGIIFLMSIVKIAIVGAFISGLLLVPILFVVTAHSGVMLSKNTKHFKEYSTFMGVKYGKWRSSRGLTDVAILTIRKKSQVNSTFGGGALEFENVETGVYFLIPSHRRRILIKICKNKNEADQAGRLLADALNKNFTVFDPKVSEASKARRYR